MGGGGGPVIARMDCGHERLQVSELNMDVLCHWREAGEKWLACKQCQDPCQMAGWKCADATDDATVSYEKGAIAMGIQLEDCHARQESRGDCAMT